LPFAPLGRGRFAAFCAEALLEWSAAAAAVALRLGFGLGLGGESPADAAAVALRFGFGLGGPRLGASRACCQ